MGSRELDLLYTGIDFSFTDVTSVKT